MRRQLSDSAVISTGNPARVYCQVMSWLRVGPPRTLTLSGLRLTKRGTGNPLDGPAPSAAFAIGNGMRKARPVSAARKGDREVCLVKVCLVKVCLVIFTQKIGGTGLD